MGGVGGDRGVGVKTPYLTYPLRVLWWMTRSEESFGCDLIAFGGEFDPWRPRGSPQVIICKQQPSRTLSNVREHLGRTTDPWGRRFLVTRE